MARVSGLDHQTMLDLAPPEFVAVAAGAGFDAVGLRIAPVSRGEQTWPAGPGSPLLAETMRRCGDTGLVVLDVEAIRLEPGLGLAGCESVLETAAALGARYLNVICADPDTARFTDRLAELVQMARPFRVRPVIEFMAWRPLRTLAGAVAIATGSGGAGLLLDTLHIQRCGATTEEIAAVDPALLGYLQLCDAPANAQTGDAVTEARTMRLLPGAGELPLRDVLGVLPEDLPVAVEAPSLAARRDLTPAEFARQARRALKAVAG
jgi:sugar phosphate isomerase/epimerase